MVQNHAYQTFEPKYVIDYRALKVINKSTLLFVTPNGKECKTNINDMKPYTSLEQTEDAWNLVQISMKTVKTMSIT